MTDSVFATGGFADAWGGRFYAMIPAPTDKEACCVGLAWHERLKNMTPPVDGRRVFVAPFDGAWPGPPK